MEWEEELHRRGGVARIRDLLAAGADRRLIERRIGSGLVRIGHGVVALPEHDPAIARAVLAGGVLTCGSAATHLGLWIGDPPPRLHVAAMHSRLPRGLVNHRVDMSPWSLGAAPGPIAPVAVVVVHALRCLRAEDAVAMAESAFKKMPGVEADVVGAVAAGSRNAPARHRLSLVSGRADSYPEVVLRLLLLRAGFPFREQVELEEIGRVDFLVAGRMIVEIDGFEYHRERQATRRDEMRDHAAARRGLAVLRFLPEFVRFQPEYVVEQIRAVLATQAA